MHYLFEFNDKRYTWYEAFLFDAAKDVLPIRAHWHYFMEMIFILEGTALINCEQHTYVLESGDLILFHPKMIHAISATTPSPLKYGVLKFDIHKLQPSSTFGPDLASIFQAAKTDIHTCVFFSAEQLKSFPMKEIFLTCIHETQTKDFGYDLLIYAKLTSLLIAIARFWRKNDFNTDLVLTKNNTYDSIDTITEYIDAHSSEPLKVEDLAKQCHMSYSHFAKQFKVLYGQSCKEYIAFIRVCKAEDLLRFTDFDLAFISQETGFSDCSHLIKTFKKYKGVTPKQFRMNGI